MCETSVLTAASSSRLQALSGQQITSNGARAIAVAEDAGLDPVGTEPFHHFAAEYPGSSGDEDFRTVHSRSSLYSGLSSRRR